MGAGEQILAKLAVIEAKLDRLLAGGSAQAPTNAAALPIADDADLDGPYGDPIVKFAPKRWTGPDFKGSTMSVCSTEFLDAYADALQYSSEHPRAGKEKYAPYDARDAARARGWARRLRSRDPEQPAPTRSATSTPPADNYGSVADDQLPF